MKKALEGEAPSDFPLSPQLVDVQIDTHTGQAARSGCSVSQVKTEKFLKGVEPSDSLASRAFLLRCLDGGGVDSAFRIRLVGPLESSLEKYPYSPADTLSSGRHPVFLKTIGLSAALFCLTPLIAPHRAHADSSAQFLPAGLVFPEFTHAIQVDPAALPFQSGRALQLEYAPAVLGSSLSVYDATYSYSTQSWGLGVGYNGWTDNEAGMTHLIVAGGGVKVPSPRLDRPVHVEPVPQLVV